MADQTTPTSEEDVSASSNERGRESESSSEQGETQPPEEESPQDLPEPIIGAPELPSRLSKIRSALVETKKALDETERRIDGTQRVLDKHPFISMRKLAALRRYGLTCAQAIDYMAVRECGYGQTEWGEMTNRSRQGVNGNVTRAQEILNDET